MYRLPVNRLVFLLALMVPVRGQVRQLERERHYESKGGYYSKGSSKGSAKGSSAAKGSIAAKGRGKGKGGMRGKGKGKGKGKGTPPVPCVPLAPYGGKGKGTGKGITTSQPTVFCTGIPTAAPSTYPPHGFNQHAVTDSPTDLPTKAPVEPPVGFHPDSVTKTPTVSPIDVTTETPTDVLSSVVATFDEVIEGLGATDAKFTSDGTSVKLRILPGNSKDCEGNGEGPFMAIAEAILISSPLDHKVSWTVTPNLPVSSDTMHQVVFYASSAVDSFAYSYTSVDLGSPMCMTNLDLIVKESESPVSGTFDVPAGTLSDFVVEYFSDGRYSFDVSFEVELIFDPPLPDPFP